MSSDPTAAATSGPLAPDQAGEALRQLPRLAGGAAGRPCVAGHAPGAEVADQQRFTAERAFEVIARNGVTHGFLTPTALKMMAQVPEPAKKFDLDLT